MPDGSQNTFVGRSAGRLNLSGSSNTMIRLQRRLRERWVSGNTMVGSVAGINCTGAGNTIVGHQAGWNTATGFSNVFLGMNAGFSNTTGTLNTYMGYNAGGTAALSKATAISYNAQVSTSNSLVLGGTGADTVNVGIGVTAPQTELEVNGFTMLGSNAPKIKMLKLTGTTAAVQGSAVAVPHGLVASKVTIGKCSGRCRRKFVHSTWFTLSSGYQFQYNVQALVILIGNITGASANILSRPLTVLITYEE
ncbi:MAG: hypothetical protein IPI55_17265 [Flavobacteriales bacterium]|nr:hypothetical protein [Flavobacteriales bacterium]